MWSQTPPSPVVTSPDASRRRNATVTYAPGVEKKRGKQPAMNIKNKKAAKEAATVIPCEKESSQNNLTVAQVKQNEIVKLQAEKDKLLHSAAALQKKASVCHV
ncbi:unnamed protein product [Clonostachys rosea f. rosea IK726]|uniref:Uncharacterized protein n=1 Tax=Clonostachys rosea f. rosea IK726 TaxID=1349383 RepID=A0ACA9TG56_BIOOC|nr:unnamed protein product [Clonostachys rosea f. rosea IK726]